MDVHSIPFGTVCNFFFYIFFYENFYLFGPSYIVTQYQLLSEHPVFPAKYMPKAYLFPDKIVKTFSVPTLRTKPDIRTAFTDCII